MPELDPQMAEILKVMAEALKDRPDRTTMTAVEARAQTTATTEAFWNTDRPSLWSVYNLTIPGPDGPIPARLYDPGVSRPAPCLVYVHGGGWVICNLDSHDNLCRRLALAGGFMVLSVDYRLAPEHKFPAGLDDCLAAARWTAAQGSEWGIDTGRLVIGGDSAGANLSLASLMALRDAGEDLMRGGVLIYGAYSPDTESPSHKAYGDGSYVLSTDEMLWFWNHYIRSEEDNKNPLAVPLLGDVKGLPPLLVTAAEFDPLLDESHALVTKLIAAGQPHRFDLWPGVTHACIQMSRMLDAADKQIEDIAVWVRQALTE